MTDYDDGYGCDYGEPDGDWDDDPYADDEPDPTDHPDFERYEWERWYRRLSPLGKIRARIRGFIWRYTWRWQMKISARWLLLTGRATTESDDGPPF